MMAKKTLDELLRGEKQFGSYTVIGEGAPNPKCRMVLCLCACGNTKEVSADKLRSGRSTCCKACAVKSPKRVTNLKHGMSKSPEYEAWASMRFRCGNPSCWNFADYGGRGIKVCERWQESFDAFWADMGPRPDGCSLDRIDNDKGYEPGNVRWNTSEGQQQNRRVTRTIEWRGQTYPMSKLEKQFGLPRNVLSLRIDMGWDLERALTEPAAVKKPTHIAFGVPMATKQIIEKYGISRQMFNYRLRKGLTAEQAILAG